MSTYTINGSSPLYGSIRVGGAKNASYKMMIASLLAEDPSRLLNFSHISDVELVAEIINSLGAKATTAGDRTYLIDPEKLNSHQIDVKFGQSTRASTLFIPALLAKFGKAEVPFPGGDKIGSRPLERHFDGLKALGAQINITDQTIKISAPQLTGTNYRFHKNTHTGTETLIMAAVKARGKTILENAAQETEVDDLINFLNEMGGKITRTSSRTIEIEGVEQLDGAIHKIMPDQNQVVSFACAALATKGDVVVENARSQDLTAFLEQLEAAGAGFELGSYGIRFFYKRSLTATRVTTAVHPGFKTDWQPLWVTLMTQAEGTSILHETVSQNRFHYTSALQEMGAKIELFNPQVENPDELYNFNLNDVSTDVSTNEKRAARVTGPTTLQGGEFTVKDLRHGATLLIAGMMAQGTTILSDPDNHIDRGYENIDLQFRAMGAKIKKD